MIPGSLVVLAAGTYLSIERWNFGYLFITAGLFIIVVVILLGATFFDRYESRAIELSERDIGASGDNEVELSEEYWEVSRRIGRMGMLASFLILLAVFLMTVKP